MGTHTEKGAWTRTRMIALMAAPPSPHFDRQVRSWISDSPSYGAEPKNSGLSPVFGESLDYISTPACVTREEGCVSVVNVGRQRLGVFVNPPQPSGQSQSKA